MPQSAWQFSRVIMVSVLSAMLMLQPNLAAQIHVVSPSELQQQAAAATQTREQNLDTVTGFLSSPSAGKALQSAQMEPVQVKNAVSALSDAELAQLAPRVDKAKADFAAGNISNRDLLWIVLGLAALVLIIVAVRQ